MQTESKPKWRIQKIIVKTEQGDVSLTESEFEKWIRGEDIPVQSGDIAPINNKASRNSKLGLGVYKSPDWEEEFDYQFLTHEWEKTFGITEVNPEDIKSFIQSALDKVAKEAREEGRQEAGYASKKAISDMVVKIAELPNKIRQQEKTRILSLIEGMKDLTEPDDKTQSQASMGYQRGWNQALEAIKSKIDEKS